MTQGNEVEAALPRASEQLVAPESEFLLSTSDFDTISKKIYKMTGIVVPEHKRQMIYSRLSRRLREVGKKTFAEYLDHIESKSGSDELEKFTNAVTTNITGFFREEHHFLHLKSQLEGRKSYEGDLVNIWSAGCSTGQEPYSIAMSVHNPVISQGGKYRILATDIDTSVLGAAKAGTYEERRLAEIPNSLHGFVNKKVNTFEIKRELQNNIHFKRLNLFEELPFSVNFEYIFCRNVLIYFDIKHKVSVINKLVSRLAVGGFLYLGHSESLFEDVPSLRSCGKTIYEKVA